MRPTDTKTDKLSNILALYVAIALLMAGLLGYFVIKPLYKQSQDLSAQLTTVKTQTAALVQLGKDTATLQTNYVAVKGKRDQILNQLPVQSEEERLLALLGQIGSSTGVVVNSFAPGSDTGPAAADTALSVYPASISVTGNYAQIQAFLVSLETSARFISVENSSLTGSPTSSTVAGQVTFRAYYQQGDK